MSLINVSLVKGSKYEHNDSVKKIATFELVYPRFIHAELMTHRVFSRNAASSRAIPTSKLLEMVKNEPIIPEKVGYNKPGMQAQEYLEGKQYEEFREIWKTIAKDVVKGLEELQKLNIHKQTINRALEPWLPIKTLVTSTEWQNFFYLRDSEYAQPEIAQLAKEMKEIYYNSGFKELNGDFNYLDINSWHIPYIEESDVEFANEFISHTDKPKLFILLMLSAARCARVSYAIGGISKKTKEQEYEKALELFKNKHLSVFEHQAHKHSVELIVKSLLDKEKINSLIKYARHLDTPESQCESWFDVRNLRGYRSFRVLVEREVF